MPYETDWKSIWALVLRFIQSFHFLSFSLDSLVKNLVKDNFRYLSQEFDVKKQKLDARPLEKANRIPKLTA